MGVLSALKALPVAVQHQTTRRTGMAAAVAVGAGVLVQAEAETGVDATACAVETSKVCLPGGRELDTRKRTSAARQKSKQKPEKSISTSGQHKTSGLRTP